MPKPPNSKPIASPVSTGGGGTDYERRVGAYYLATVLLRAVPRGQAAGIARDVRFQRLYEGDPLDDLIVMSDLPTGEAKLALQIKRDLTFGEKDQRFDKVMRACWETFKSPAFNLGIDRFGLVLGLYSKTIDEHYQSVLTWARTSADATDFLSRVSQEGLSSKHQRNFLQLIRAKLDSYEGTSVSADDLWEFLRSMVILHFDFQQDGSRDYAYAVACLCHILPPERNAESPRLFTQLVEYAAEGNRTAGSFNSQTLTERLTADGFSLLPAPDCRADLKRLREHADFVLEDIRTDIGGLVLNRTAVVTDALEKIEETGLLELIGLPGAGKSAILKKLVEHQRNEGPVIVLAWDRITGTGWEGFASDHQLTRLLGDLLLTVSGSRRPCLFIDGVDRVVDSGARKVVNDLLRSLAKIPRNPDGSVRWTVVVTAREENLQELHAWLDWRSVGLAQTLKIPELTDEEVKIVAEQSPRLKPLLSLKQLQPIIKNPFMLQLLEDRRMLPDADTLPPIATEIEVSVVWWENLVGGDGVQGRARQQALLQLGKRVAQSPGRRLSDEGITAEVVISLESDRILLRDAGRDVYRFSHDLLEDWVLYRVLDQRREELAAYLQELGQPLGLFRAVQLLGCSVLEQNETADIWIQLIEQIEQSNELALKWRQALLTAPLLSTRARELLDKAEPFLVANNAQRLIDLLTALRTVEVIPNFPLLPFIVSEQDNQHENLLSVLLADPIPKWHVWVPLMGWLLERADKLSTAVRPEAARLMEIWQKKAPTGSIYRKDIGEIALAWLKQDERRMWR